MTPSGTVTIDGVTYKAFENSFNKLWYIVIGNSCSGTVVAQNIVAKSGRDAIKKWQASR